MMKLAPEWGRTSDPVIRSPARYRWTTAPAPVAMVGFDISSLCSMCEYRYTTLCNTWRTWVEVGIVGIYRFAMSVRGKSGVAIHDIRIT